ncbi:MAG TPA: transposase [Streptosporangiaceae bacterium]|jgi:hypothetical protein
MMLPPPASSAEGAFSLTLLARLPLAEAFYRVWSFLATDAALDALFHAHRGRCYQDRLSFAELVGLLADALTRYHGSGHRAFAKAAQRQQLSVRPRAAYGKLGRLPLPLAEAFLSALTARLRPLFPPGLYRTPLPAGLAGLAVVVVDGKKIKDAAKRLLACRGRPGKLYGGKVLAAYLPAEGLVVAMAADADGEANDCRLVPRLVPLARGAVTGPRLWVADRQFCDLDQPGRFAAGGDHFLIRFSHKTSFAADPERPARAGVDGAGRPFTQEWGWMGSAGDRRRRYVRRITLPRGADEAVALVTDLLDESAHPGAELLAVYRTRWQIEGVFQQITEVFALDHLIGCTPQATVFQASLCLVVYNAVQLIRGYAAVAGPEPLEVDRVSAEKVFQDLHEELVSLHRALSPEELLRALPAGTEAGEVRQRLRSLLGRAWTADWKKAPPPKRRPPRPKAKQSGAHTSVHKLLRQAQRQKDRPGPHHPS